MQIDWLTVGAQWFNFIVLVVLLRRFLYGPIVRAMARRQQAIEDNMALARQKAEEAESEAAAYREQIREFETQKAALLSAAHDAASEQRNQLIAYAKAEVDAKAKQWRQEVEYEKSEFQEQLSRELIHLVVGVAQKALADLASQRLEQAVLAKFLDRLQTVSAQDKRSFAESADRSAVLSASFHLTAADRADVGATVTQVLGRDVVLSYVHSDESACGIAFLTPAFKFEWRIENYIEDLQKQLDQALDSARSYDAG